MHERAFTVVIKIITSFYFILDIANDFGISIAEVY